jgi:hypothetical protein
VNPQPPPRLDGQFGRALRRRDYLVVGCLVSIVIATIFALGLIARFKDAFQEGGSARVRNGTSTALEIRLVGPTRTRVVSNLLAPGSSEQLIRYGDDDFVDKLGCTVGDAIALDLAGREIARHGPGICYGTIWVVTIPAESSP